MPSRKKYQNIQTYGFVWTWGSSKPRQFLEREIDYNPSTLRTGYFQKKKHIQNASVSSFSATFSTPSLQGPVAWRRYNHIHRAAGLSFPRNNPAICLHDICESKPNFMWWNWVKLWPQRFSPIKAMWKTTLLGVHLPPSLWVTISSASPPSPRPLHHEDVSTLARKSGETTGAHSIFKTLNARMNYIIYNIVIR